MRRTILLPIVVSSAVSILVTVLVLTVALPAVVRAQEARIRAEQFTVVGDNGVDRIRLQTGPGVSAASTVLDAQGQPRVEIRTGGSDAAGGVNPVGAGINIWASNGAMIGRLGTGPEGVGANLGVWAPNGAQIGRLGTGPGGVGANLALSDQEGRNRIRLNVAEDGTPSIEMLDANGNVTWSAR